MKIALSAWSCHHYFNDKTWSNTDFIDFVGTTAASGVELLSMFWEPGRDLPEVREALKRNGLSLACFGACNNFGDPDPQKRQEQVQDIVLSVDTAEALGAKVVRVFAADAKKDVSYTDAKVWIIEGLKEAADYAMSKGITLCLENHGVFAGKAEQVTSILTEVNSPALRSTFDMGNFLLVDEDPAAALAELLPRIAHVHVKDFLQVDPKDAAEAYTSLSGSKFIGKVPGEGDVGVEDKLAKLKDAGYEGWLTIEYEGHEEQKQGSLRAISLVDGMLPRPS